MITVETLRELPVFAGVAENVLAHVAARTADIRLRAGDYLIHEGEIPAFFVLLDGKLEVTKNVGGIERIITVRDQPGDFGGETPLLLGAPAVANMRATAPSRVARIEGVDFHTLVGHSHALAARMMAAMRERVAGIGEFAEITAAEVVIVGRPNDRECFEMRDFLSRNRITYDFLATDDPLAAEHIPDLPSYGDHCPIVRLADGAVLVAPEIREVAARLPSLSVAPKECDYDVTIVGGGPAGLGAAVYGASEGLRTLMVERVAPGGQAGTSSRIENYLGFPTGLSGDDLGHRALEQAKRFGAEIVVTRRVESIRPGAAGAAHTIVLDRGEEVRSRIVVIAAGVAWRTLGVPSLEQFIGGGVFYGAARSEALEAQGKDVFLIGAGNSAGQAAMFFSNYAKSVTLVCRGPKLEKSMSYYLIEELHTKENVRILLDSEITAGYGVVNLEAIDVRDGRAGTLARTPAQALFVLIGAIAETAWLPQEIARDADGYVLTGPDAARSDIGAARWPLERTPYLLETTVPGIFAAGDVRHGSIKRVAASVGEGSMTIAFAHQYLAEQAGAPPLSL
jgi:thioredoxin reductase (NADPH)